MADRVDPSDDPAARFARVGNDPRARRARHLRTYGPPRRHTNLIWLGIAIAGAVVFVVLILAVLEKTRWTAADPVSRATGQYASTA